MKAKITRKSHSRMEAGRLVTYRPGDEIDLPESSFLKLKDRMKRLVKRGRPPKKKEGNNNAE